MSEIEEERRALGQQLRALRKRAGMSQRQFAPLTGYSRTMLSHAELGLQHISRDFWQRCEAVLRAGNVLTSRYDEIETPREEPVPDLECPACHQPLMIFLAMRPR